MKSFLSMVYVFVGVFVCCFLFLLFSSNKYGDKTEALCGGVINRYYCGNGILSDYGDPKEGRKLFRYYCAQCHDKSMNRDMTGPALSGSLNKWNRDSTQLQLYFSDSPAYLDTTTNLRLIELRETWKPTVSHKYQLSMQELKDIMSYVEGNG